MKSEHITMLVLTDSCFAHYNCLRVGTGQFPPDCGWRISGAGG
jgi:hypothetical protein